MRLAPGANDASKQWVVVIDPPVLHSGEALINTVVLGARWLTVMLVAVPTLLRLVILIVEVTDRPAIAGVLSP